MHVIGSIIGLSKECFLYVSNKQPITTVRVQPITTVRVCRLLFGGCWGLRSKGLRFRVRFQF
jgi:hypothetical protein